MIYILSLVVIMSWMTVITVLLWMMRCNNITLKQRKHMINNVPIELFHDVAEIDYSDHLKAVTWFRDPRKLYSPQVQEYFENHWITK